MLTAVHDAQEANGSEASRSLLDETVRDGAPPDAGRRLQAEVAAYVAQFADQLDENGHRLVVRNAYRQPCEVLTAAGAVEVRSPRVNDRRIDPDTGERQRFSSAILPAWARKSPQMSEVLRTADQDSRSILLSENYFGPVRFEINYQIVDLVVTGGDLSAAGRTHRSRSTQQHR